MFDPTDIENAVGRETVIQVLQARGVTVTPLDDSGINGMLRLSKGEYFENKRLPEVCRKKLLRYLERKFDVSVELFYNPQLLPNTRIQ
jgi:hypothetical protein